MNPSSSGPRAEPRQHRVPAVPLLAQYGAAEPNAALADANTRGLVHPPSVRIVWLAHNSPTRAHGRRAQLHDVSGSDDPKGPCLRIHGNPLGRRATANQCRLKAQRRLGGRDDPEPAKPGPHKMMKVQTLAAHSPSSMMSARINMQPLMGTERLHETDTANMVQFALSLKAAFWAPCSGPIISLL
jgi:hypothetical protein